MRDLSLNGPAVVMIGTDHGRAGEDGGIEEFVGGGGRTRRAGRRMGKVGERELFGDGVGHINIRRLARLKVIVDSADNGVEDAVVSGKGNGLVGRSWIGKSLRDNFNGVASRIGACQRRH